MRLSTTENGKLAPPAFLNRHDERDWADRERSILLHSDPSLPHALFILLPVFVRIRINVGRQAFQCTGPFL